MLEFIIIVLLVTVGLAFAGYEVMKPQRHAVAAHSPCDGVMHDRFVLMWHQQQNFMRLLSEKRNFPAFPVDITSKPGQQLLKDIRNHMMEELFEAGQHLKNSKQHRITDIKQFDRDEYLEELADALHLYIELLIASGITPDEIYDAYMKKGAVNEHRILNGY